MRKEEDLAAIWIPAGAFKNEAEELAKVLRIRFGLTRQWHFAAADGTQFPPDHECAHDDEVGIREAEPEPELKTEPAAAYDSEELEPDSVPPSYDETEEEAKAWPEIAMAEKDSTNNPELDTGGYHCIGTP
jgi:hypothetical protein